MTPENVSDDTVRMDPRPKFITPEGERRLRDELDRLWRVERPAVTQAVAEAAALGDRSENAEYTYGKRRLREIDRRVRFLRGRLDGMVVVRQPPSDRSRVFFGAWVNVVDPAGIRSRYRIVGPDEFDQHPGYISMAAPLGRALLGRRAGDTIEVDVPAGRQELRIETVDYTAARTAPE